MSWVKVELKAPPSHVNASIVDYARFLIDRRKWCEEHAGEFGVSWSERPLTADFRRREYSFEDSKIAMLFQLRWS